MTTPKDGAVGYEQRQGAWVHESAVLGEDVELAPGVVVGADVVIGAGCRFAPNAVVLGPTLLGKENRVHSGAVLGDAPQDLGYEGEPTRLEIGDRNVFREGVTIHRGAPKSTGRTRIGSDNLFMAMSHVGHDSVVEDHCVFANAVLIAGHCHIESHVTIGGNSSMIQFATAGRFAFIGGLLPLRKDVEPFMIHDRARAGTSAVTESRSVNIIGLERAGFSEESIRRLRKAHRILFRDNDGSLNAEIRAQLEQADTLCPEVDELLAFLTLKAAGRYGRQREKMRG
jgi:UDP-N-acetylglucosamine acyltransferase